MNQVIKNIYRLANQKQIDYICKLADLQPEEVKIVNMWHQGEPDLNIQEEIGISRNAYDAAADLIEEKVTITVFGLIDKSMWECGQA